MSTSIMEPLSMEKRYISKFGFELTVACYLGIFDEFLLTLSIDP